MTIMSTIAKVQKTDYYLNNDDELSDVHLDQNIIINEAHLKYLSSSYDILHQAESFIQECDEFYPYVNSYYPYTEDVDALERVNHLLGSEPSVVSSDSSSSSLFTNYKFPYSEKEAQTVYLSSTPLSFIILGKPEVGEKELAKKIADHWKCVYIEPETLIQQEIQSQSRAGQCIEFNLRCGRAVGIDLILKLVEKRIKSESAKHRGVIICGLPVIANDLYAEDPVSTVSAVFTANEILQEALHSTFDLAQSFGDGPTSAPSRDRTEDEWDEVEEPHAEEENQTSTGNKTIPRKPSDLPSDVGDDVDFGFLPQISTNYEDQLKFLFNLLKTPFLIIQMVCCTEDIIRKRNECRFSVYSKCEIQVNSQQRISGHFDEYIDKRHLVRPPRNFPANVCTQLDNYHSTAIKFIERRVLMHDPQYFIKVDARSKIEDMLKVILRKLTTLPHYQIALPAHIRRSEMENDLGEDKTEIETSNIDYNQFYKLYSAQNAPDRFKWSWSDWGTKCPVSMKEGYCKQGDMDCAVHFMNKMYFLANEKALLSFCRNPRPYLIPANPRSLCKIFIFGPQASGKSTVAKCLSYLYNGTIVHPQEILKNIIDQQTDKEKERIRQAAINEAIAMLIQQRAEQADKLEEERVQAIKDWVSAAVSNIEQLIILLEEFDKDQTRSQFEISSFPMAMEKKNILEIETETTIGIRKLRDIFEENKIPFSKDINVLEQLMSDKRKLLTYLPGRLKKKIKPLPVDINDKFVQRYADEAVANLAPIHFDLNSNNLKDIFKSIINNIEMDNIAKGFAKGGWVIDDMICDKNLLDDLYPEYMADDVILLWDSSPNFEFLVDRYKNFKVEEFSDFRDLFINLGKADAAFPLYSDFSTNSFKIRMVQNILSEIIDNEEIYGSDPEGSNRGEALRQEIKEFYKKWETVKQFFGKVGKNLIMLDVANKTLAQLLEEVIRTIDSQYSLGARKFTQEDRAEEVRNLTPSDPTLAQPAEDQPVQYLDENRKYGDTSNYCPVTFHNKSVLWKGKDNYAAVFQDKVYLMSSEEDLDEFLKSPNTFVIGTPPKHFPRPRICVIGYTGVGKTKIAQELSKNFCLTYISFLNVLKKTYNIMFDNSFFEILANDRTDSSVLGYLQNGQMLSETFYSDDLSTLWFGQQTKHSGFVFDDFPKRESDLLMMVKYKLIPDMILVLTAKENFLKTTLIENLCQQWQMNNKKGAELYTEMNRAAVVKWEEDRRTRYQELLNERREQRYAQKRQSKDTEGNEESSEKDVDKLSASESSQVSFNSVEEQKDIDEINIILENELPEIVTQVTTETFEDVKYRIETGVSRLFNFDKQAIEAIKEKCRPNNIPLESVAFDFGLPDRTLRHVFYLVDPIENRTPSFFERCYDITNQLAESLLTEGYYLLSRFGRLCPVQYKVKANPFHMYSLALKKDEVHPVIHRSFIYFVHGSENLEKFKKDPLFYVDVENVEFPAIPFVMAITGPPKCGKSLLAQRICEDFGLKVITRGQAIRDILSKFPDCSLTYHMENLLRKGWEVTDEMVVKAVEASCLEGESTVQGVVFDGFPNTISEVRHLSYAGLVPNLVIDLEATKDEIIECLQKCPTKQNLPRYSTRFLDHLLTEWNLTAQEFRTWFDREYQVMTKLPMSTSAWYLKDKTRKFMLSVFFEIKHYYTNISKGWPLRLANLKVSPLEFLERQSEYKTFCPCCLHFSNELVNGGSPPDRTGVVQYKHHFYWICDEHIEQFLSSPDSYLPPYCKNHVPHDLPKRIFDLKAAPFNVAEDGICLLCYKEFRSLRKGSLEFAAEYREQVFLFDSVKCLETFLRTPQKWNFQISCKQGQDYGSINYLDLPVLGMLEQYVAVPVIKALQFTVRRRPLIPGLGIAASGLIGIGIFLKVYHVKLPSKYKDLYVEAAELFHRRRKKLINSLSSMKNTMNPYLYYQETMPSFKIPDSNFSESSESARKNSRCSDLNL